MNNENRNKSYSGNVEWYTPPAIIALVRQVMGQIDLDPASNEIANEIVKATTFYTAEQDGLSLPWEGNVFCNPPYSGGQMAKFASKLLFEFWSGKVPQAIMLTNSASDTQWYHNLLSACTAVCLTRGRTRFLTPSGELGKSPVMGQTLFYFGAQPRRFRKYVSELGAVLFPVDEIKD